MAQILAHTVLVITSAVLFYAAWTDLREFKIRNELVVVLAGLFVVHAVLSGRWVEAYWNVAVATVMFLIMLAFYAREGMGGGDVKLLTVAFLWVGYRCGMPFVILLLGFAVIQAVIVKSITISTLGARFRWLNALSVDGKRIPFAPAIAAALIGTFLTGCLDEPPEQHFRNLQQEFPLGKPFPGLKPMSPAPPQSQ